MPVSKKKGLGKIGKYAALGLLIIICFLFIVPFLWMIRSSLIPLYEILKTPIQWFPKKLDLGNYVEALTILPFGRFFFNTSFILVMSLIGILISATLAAFSFSRLDWPGRDVVFYILMSTLMLPAFATMIPTFLGWRLVGALNSYLPLIIPNWFSGGATGHLSSVFYIFLLRQFFMTIPRELDEAARIDGASHFTVYWKILLPLVKPGIMVVILFASFSIWNDFLSPAIYLNDVDKYTLNLGLRLFSGMYNAQWNLMMAAATVVTIPPIILFIVGQRYFIEGISFSGIKG